MWVLLAAILVGAIVVGYLLQGHSTRMTAQGIDLASDMARTTAIVGARVLSLCAQKPAGTYTQYELGGGGFPAETPVGASWMCHVSAGGWLPNGNMAIIYLNKPPQDWAIAGIHGRENQEGAVTVQMNFATQVAAIMAQQIGSGALSGVIVSGDTTPYLRLSQPYGHKVDLKGGVPGVPFPYTTPSAAAGVLRDGF